MFSIRILSPNGISIIFCILAMGIDIITETFTDVNFAFSQPFVLIWAAEVAHHVIHAVSAVITGSCQVRHS